VRQILPHLILENYRAGIYGGEFTATGLFVDITGFSSMADVLMQHGQHGAEVLAWIIRQIFDLLNSEILTQGGFIVGFAGDSVTALFQDEIDTLPSAQRALAAAWGFQKQMANRPSIDTVYGVFPISAKAGLAYGRVNWGILRSKDKTRATYYFSGEPVNDSASAEHHAKAGEIVLSKNGFERLNNDVTCQVRDDFYLVDGINCNLPQPRPVALAEPDPAILRVFFPDILLKPNVPNEFRQVVNLFIQLPDLPAAQLADFMGNLFDAQARYGGLIGRVDYGDKGCNLLLFWGAPIAYENDINRALNFISDLRVSGKYSFRAGMTYYVSCAGFIGSDQREEYTCYGRGPSLAARLMMSASFGEVWLDGTIASRAQRHFDLGFVGELNFKGFSHMEKVYLLHKPKAAIEITYKGEMIGRESELQQLKEFVAPLWQGNFAGGLIIWGDAGMGKSRLINEFQASWLFLRDSLLWALCQSNQLLRQSLDPFRYWLRSYFGVSATHDTQENLDRFHAQLQKIIAKTDDALIRSELERTTSILAALVDLHWENSLYEQLDAQGRYDNTFIAMSTLIKAESRCQPLIVLIEDAQYIDDDSLAFLLYLNRSLAADTKNYPVAILATSRLEPAGPSMDTGIFKQQIKLGVIPGAALARLAETNLGGAVAPGLLRLLNDRADGNPFFAEQILSYLHEENLLHQGDTGWDISPSAYDSALPVDIHAILVARLDQLTREVRDVIQTAAILGREFEVQVLARMLSSETNLLAALTEAENAAIWSAPNEIHYLFHHALLRDAAYTMQMQARREELHAVAVNALETLYSGQIQHHCAELSYHAERANLVEKACHYLQLAGDVSREAYQNALAVDYYTRALALTPEDDQAARFILLLNREKAYSYQGQKELQQQDLDVLQKLTAHLEKEKQVEVALRTIKYLVYSGNYSQAIPKIKAAITLARSIDKLDVAVQAYIQWAVCLYRQGKLPQAVHQNEKGLSLARQIGDFKAEAKLLNTLGLIHLEQKELDKAKYYFETSLQIASEVDSPGMKARILNNLGMLSGYYGDLSSGQEYYERSLVLAREIGDRKGESIVLSNLGWIAGTLGDYAKAREYTQQTLRNSRETGDRFTEAYSLINLSSQTGAWGEYESALTYARQGLELTRQIGDPSGMAWSWTYLGHSLLALRRLDEASEAYQAALGIRRSLNQPALATEPASGLARARLASGDLAQAQTQVEVVLEHIDAGGNFEGADEPLRIYLNCYIVLKASAHPRASEILQTAHQALQARVNNLKDENTRQVFIENIAINREIRAAWQQNSADLERA
jgi:predicted ATPase/class 3 adenylate cyclase